MSILKDLKYTKEHEWVKQEDGTVRIGITDFAQAELGDIVFLKWMMKSQKTNHSEA